MLLKSRCLQILRQCICYHLVGSALHQLDYAFFDELVDEIKLKNYVLNVGLNPIWQDCGCPLQAGTGHGLSGRAPG